MEQFSFSLITAIIAVMIGVFLALMIRKGKKSSEKWLDMCGMLPNMVPGIVMVVGLILFWNSPYMPLSILQYTSHGNRNVRCSFYLIRCSM